MAKKKCVLVGTGHRGTLAYIKPIFEDFSEHAQCCGLYDAVKSRALAVSREYGDIPVFDDFETMLDQVKPDFVIITTKDADHHTYVIRALELGYDVITEKPITTTRKNALAIMEAEKRSGKSVRVIFNMRYMKPIEDLKTVISSGVIGEVRHIDFTWLLDRVHGADYFHRWHSRIKNSNSLLIHKATHHFDVINWVTGKKPASVFARGVLEFYGKNGAFRGACCHKCEHTAKCPFYLDIIHFDFYKKLYYDVEQESGYLRDGCVFAEDIDIYDRMALNVLFDDGATMNYSLSCYNPDEGYRIYFTGTKGRAELVVFTSGHHKDDPLQIKVTTEDGTEQIIETRFDSGNHGGADDKLLEVLFGINTDPDPLGRNAGSYEGYLSLAIGDMAVQSIQTGREVTLEDLG